MSNPETIEIHGLSTIHKLCKFGADRNMEGCSFTEIVERMFIELSKSKAVPEWISVDDELPPTDTTVLICWASEPDIEPEKDYMDICLDTGCPFWSNYLNDQPTHWMHLPQAPKAQEQSHDGQNP